MKYGKEDIDFIARHFRKDCFDRKTAWRKLGLGRSFRFNGWKIAASIAAVTVLSVSAALFVYHERSLHEVNEVIEGVTVKAVPEKSLILDFDNMSLSSVVAEIENIYDVKILNVPTDADDRYLTLYYEGNVYDLIEAINDILDSNLIVAYSKTPQSIDSDNR